jgi:hypothetical protein
MLMRVIATGADLLHAQEDSNPQPSDPFYSRGETDDGCLSDDGGEPLLKGRS